MNPTSTILPVDRSSGDGVFAAQNPVDQFGDTGAVGMLRDHVRSLFDHR
jgi:hypothetical protein